MNGTSSHARAPEKLALSVRNPITWESSKSLFPSVPKLKQAVIEVFGSCFDWCIDICILISKRELDAAGKSNRLLDFHKFWDGKLCQCMLYTAWKQFPKWVAMLTIVSEWSGDARYVTWPKKSGFFPSSFRCISRWKIALLWCHFRAPSLPAL